MAFIDYTFEQLKLDFIQFNLNISGEWYLMELFYKCLITSGLRFSELRNSHRFTMNPDTSGIWHTLKGNDNRFFYAQYFPARFYIEYVNNVNFFHHISLSTANSFFARHYPNPAVYHKTKSLKSHLCRHYVMKMMHESGLSIEEIGLEFGEVDIKNVENYVYSELKLKI